MRPVIGAVLLGAAVFAGVYFYGEGRSGGLQAQPPPPPGAGLEQRDRGEGGVEIAVTLGGPGAAAYQPERYTVLLVAMTTHSGDLSVYDLRALSELRAGGRTFRPVRWISTSDDPHHRSGVLLFPRVDARQAVELRLANIAGVPVRTFRWTP
jgi:hypothetical protein